jgi:hypothetical protein
VTGIEKIFNDITIAIVSIPCGAGREFLGYLQHYCDDKVPALKEEDFPKNNYWGVFNCRAHIGLPIDEVSMGNTYDDWEYVAKAIDDPLGDSIQNTHKALAIEISKVLGTGQNSNASTAIIHPHNYLVGITHRFKNVKHLLSMDLDLEGHERALKLQILKTYTKREAKARLKNYKDRASTFYKNQQIGLKESPPIIKINYNKMFINVDRNEIKRFFTSTLSARSILDQTKLDNICEMIRIYSKLNEEML